MKLFTKLALTSIALATMLQAEVTLIGIDGGITVLGARVGIDANLNIGKKSNTTSNTISYACPSAVASAPVDPCATQPCVIVEDPCPTTYVIVCDPCDPCNY